MGTFGRKIDEDDPEAAWVISVALNKKNEAAMEIAHTEVMTSLVGLCKPEPGKPPTVVVFEPVRDKLVELYGSIVDHPDFHHAFRLVMDSGGYESPRMADLHDFTSVHVNPKLRKLRFEAYGVVTPLPYEDPRMKNALLKWAWKQSPVRTWCPLPPALGWRCNKESRYAMPLFFRECEEAMIMMSKCALAVAGSVGERGRERERAKIKWIGEQDIGLVSKLIAVPKNEEGKTVGEQEEARHESD